MRKRYHIRKMAVSLGLIYGILLIANIVDKPEEVHLISLNSPYLEK